MHSEEILDEESGEMFAREIVGGKDRERAEFIREKVLSDEQRKELLERAKANPKLKKASREFLKRHPEFRRK